MIARERLLEVFERFGTCHLAVLGDVIVDQYLWGRVERISPEAPVPIVQVVRETMRPGGAANVAANLQALGVHPHLVGVLGDDGYGRQLREALNESGIDTRGLVIDPGRATTVKSRVLGHNQQMIRIDRENTEHLAERVRRELELRLDDLLPRVAGVIVSDYAKGVVGRENLPAIIRRFREAGRFVAVDPRLKNFPYYSGATVITPNTKEAESVLGTVFEDEQQVLRGGRALRLQSGADAILMTRGEHGMTLFEGECEPVSIPTQALEVFDVTGAGDTVIGTFAAAMAASLDLREAAEVSNLAAGVVVGIVGTATVKPAQILEHWDRIHVRSRTGDPAERRR